MAAYTPISLAEIMSQAGQIKAQQQKGQMADLQLQEAQKQKADTEGIDAALQANPNVSLGTLAQQYGMAGVQAGTQLNSARAADLLQQNRQLYTAANQVANADDPVATAQQVAPNFIADFDKVHGPGSFAQLPPDQVKQLAAGLAQHALVGLVDPDKQYAAQQQMLQDRYKQEGPGGEAARNANTVNAENARAAASRAVTIRGQDLASERNKPQLVEVPQPDGSVQKQWVVPGATTGTNVGVSTTPAGPGAGRVQQMVGRITLAGNEVSRSAANLMEMKSSGNAGWLGIGKEQPHGILNSAKSALANVMSADDTRSYNIKVAGVTRNLAAIEAAGNMPPGSLTSQMGAVIAQPGDTDINRLERMAEIRQIADAGLESILTQPSISKAQIDQINGIRDKIAKSIPFTQHDVEMLKQSKDPTVTMTDLMKQQGLGKQTPAPADVQALLDKYR
jgi:hypothetical protein